MDFAARIFLCFCLFLTCNAAVRALAVDGRLDEPEWASARVFSEFRVTDPLTQEMPKYPVEARVLARREGLFVALRVGVPRGQRTYGRSPRDSEPMDADSVGVFVDFAGQGRTAYEFTVSLSNSERDGIVLNQNQSDHDWDATWLHAVSEDDAAWYVEILIPWSAAPMPEIDAPTRRISVWFQANNRKLAQTVSYPATSIRSPTFVQDMLRIDVPKYPTSTLNWAPYVSLNHDFVRGSSRARAGADVFWKPNGENQLSATVNPDFSQVESDDFVANYTPIETYFTEKRPFFTEGQSLFDVRTQQNGRLVYTRRIGDAPDAGGAPRSDILGAAKYTGLTGPLEYGAFAAVENNSSDATGRRYFVARTRFKSDALSLGYLGTYVDRPTLQRRAAVHELDWQWLPRAAFSLDGQFIGTSVRHPADGAGESNARGFGATVQAGYAPGGVLEQYLRMLWFDRNFNIDDLGYMERNSLHQIQSLTYLYKRLYPETSPIYNSNFYIDLRYRENDRQERLPAHAEIAHYWQFRRLGSTFAYAGVYTSGIDDLIAPSLGSVTLPTQKNVGFYWKADQYARLRNYLEVDYYQEGLSDWAWEFVVRPTYFFSADLNLALSLDYIDSPDWLVYRYDTQTLGRFARRQLVSSIKLNWYTSARQELQINLQWLGTRARARSAYRLGAATDLVPDATRPLTDFSVSSLGFQVRYRFELAPLSDLYVVYSRGGADSRGDEEHDFGQQFHSTLTQRTGDQFFIKLAYRF